MSTLEHHRIDAAYDAVVIAEKRGVTTEWRDLMRPFGAEIRRCGLLQAVAFLYRRDQTAADHASETICAHLAELGFIQADDAGREFLDVLRKTKTPEYMVITREVLALSTWLKRAADSKGA